MKKIIISVVILVVVVAVVFVVWQKKDKQQAQQSKEQEQQAQNKEAEIDTQQEQISETKENKSQNKSAELVKRYYMSRLEYLNDVIGVEEKDRKGKIDERISRAFVTERFIGAYEELGKNGPLFYDPTICAQDFPEDLSKSSIKLIDEDLSSAKVEISLYTDWPPITIYLTKETDKWKIDKIVCSKSGGSGGVL